MSKDNTPLMFGIKETAKLFNVSQHYIRQLALTNKVKAVRVGKGKILVNYQSVADYFNSSYLNENGYCGC